MEFPTFDSFCFKMHINEYRPNDKQLLRTQWRNLAEKYDYPYTAWDMESIKLEGLVMLGEEGRDHMQTLKDKNKELFEMCLIGCVSGRIVVRNGVYIKDEERAVEFIKKHCSDKLSIFEHNSEVVIIACYQGNETLLNFLREHKGEHFDLSEHEFINIVDEDGSSWLEFKRD